MAISFRPVHRLLHLTRQAVHRCPVFQAESCHSGPMAQEAPVPVGQGPPSGWTRSFCRSTTTGANSPSAVALPRSISCPRRKSRPRVVHRGIAPDKTRRNRNRHCQQGKPVSWVGGARIDLALSLALKGHATLVENHTEDTCVYPGPESIPAYPEQCSADPQEQAPGGERAESDYHYASTSR